MGAKCFGEFVGTAVLVLLGDGVLANVVLRKSKAEGAGWLAISTGWAFAIVFGVFAAIACGSPDPALNPAVTLGVAIETGDFSKLLPFLAAQMLGAMVGAFLVWLNFLPHWSLTEDPGAKLVCFSTMPAIPNFGANLLSEAIGSFMLVLGVAAISSKEVAISGPAAGLGPYLAGVVVWGMSCLWAELPVMRLIRPVTSDPYSPFASPARQEDGLGLGLRDCAGAGSPDRCRTRGVIRSACTFLAGALYRSLGLIHQTEFRLPLTRPLGNIASQTPGL